MPKLTYLDTFKKTNNIHDHYTNQGYEYHQNLLKKVVSQEMFANPVNDASYRQIERLFEHLIDAVKQIKLAYAFTFIKQNAKYIQ